MTDIDIIGPLFDAGAPGEAPVLLEGWHANITAQGLAARPELAAWRVQPTTLRRVWAGDDPAAPLLTVALQFADEAEGRSALGLSDTGNEEGAGHDT